MVLRGNAYLAPENLHLCITTQDHGNDMFPDTKKPSLTWPLMRAFYIITIFRVEDV